MGSAETSTTATLQLTVNQNKGALIVGDWSTNADGISSFGGRVLDANTIAVYRNSSLYTGQDACTYLLITI